MDRIKETANVVIELNKYRKNEIEDYDLIKVVCDYFDEVKDEQIGYADLCFLKYISNVVGIPHFYDLLSKFEQQTEIENFDLNTFSSILYESTLHTSENNKVHKYQKEILELFSIGKLNRFFLSASTSFGKTHIVFEVIKKMDYKNVVLIFPTIALLSENLERIISDGNYVYFKDNFTIHTLSEVENFGEKNLFIFTPERFLSFIEKNETNIHFDFAFVDEVYKIDNDYIIDEEVKENERDVAYRLAVFYTLKENVDVLLAGPYIDFSQPGDQNYNNSFNSFLLQNEINLIDYNNYEIVNKSYNEIKTKKQIKIDDALTFNFQTNDKERRLIEIIKTIKEINENTIVYCSSRNGVESYAKKIIASEILKQHDSSNYIDFITHTSKNFNERWVLIQALKYGIGIHHGLIPKYIQKEIISLFNRGELKVLISTTTITEGVNTSAKNLIVLHSKKGNKDLKKFDAKNIAGRAGRFLYHYSGRVMALQNDFMDAINSKSEGIKHKNFDLDAPKDEIDLYYTGDEFLSPADKAKLENIKAEQLQRNIPDFVFEQYKVVSRVDKITIYDRIKALNPSERESIHVLIRNLNFRMDIDYNGFETILKVIEPIVKNQKLKFFIEFKGNGQYSTLTNLVHFYLIGGFLGSMRYKIEHGKTIDEAIKDTADFVYNMLKYQVVKYLGVFNIMYKFCISQETSRPFKEITGIDKLLVKLEYNALTEKGRIASDFGVPSNIVEYYENENNSATIREGFDSYEFEIFKKIDHIINKTDFT
ncbi:helicase-related protein [Flavobacterium sp. PL02]|uniref:helicase-related protein n=1 Tax=Flavobacterium sp. PL02 TaxID=3088354 RepID=UPI002B23C3B8|nr:helicase-related protein [Flavobacterium sp. PL02]MEA9414339.1 helicase-related protein [Flavobacterium sp. PL02]